ncbi:uncharacterized protein LOC143178358 [Calliopsis andreniformis]|uniref:uncharacterized protein LOC143178358 n=1 Tax=Calliopsis andreniformis TaxID=337506 RepID=UPI003FCDEDF8
MLMATQLNGVANVLTASFQMCTKPNINKWNDATPGLNGEREKHRRLLLRLSITSIHPLATVQCTFARIYLLSYYLKQCTVNVDIWKECGSDQILEQGHTHFRY